MTKIGLRFDRESETPGLICVECSHTMDRTSGPDTPRPGDIALCIRCGSANAFDEGMRFRRLTDDEMFEVAKDREFQRARRAIHEVQKKASRRVTKRPGLNELIAEAKREAHMRVNVYEYRVQQGKMTQATADHQIRLMEGIADFLERFRDNLDIFRTLAKAKDIIQQHPDVQAVLDAFPGSEAVNVTEQEEMKL